MIRPKITADFVADANLCLVNSTLYEGFTRSMKLCVPLFTSPEVIDFNGDGTLTTPVVSRSANGVIFPNTVGSNGEYTVNEDCTGTITFLPNGPHFDIFVTPHGKDLNMIQTDANTVFAGVARKVSRK